jgi:hypothetical protein
MCVHVHVCVLMYVCAFVCAFAHTCAGRLGVSVQMRVLLWMGVGDSSHMLEFWIL